MRYFIRTYSSEGDTILDITAGSSTTAVAAIRENRHFIMIEEDKKYYDVSCSRIDEEINS